MAGRESSYWSSLFWFLCQSLNSSLKISIIGTKNISQSIISLFFFFQVVKSLFLRIPFRVFTYTPPIHQFPFSEFAFPISLIPFLAIFLFCFQKITSPISLSSRTMFFPRQTSSITVNYHPVPCSPLVKIFYHFSPLSFPFKKYFHFQLFSSS